MSETRQPLTRELLARLLREAEQAHAPYEQQLGHRDEEWPEWYAGYLLEALRKEGIC